MHAIRKYQIALLVAALILLAAGWFLARLLIGLGLPDIAAGLIALLVIFGVFWFLRRWIGQRFFGANLKN